MKKVSILILLCCAIVFVGLLSMASASGEVEKVNAEQLFETKCGLCHSINRPKSKMKTSEGWKSTVMRMKNINGAPLSDEEANMIIGYLSENYGK